jgi:hypothetical protein
MKKSIGFLALAAVLLAAAPLQAAFITSISGNDMITSYSAGTLMINDSISLVVQYDDNSQVSYNNSTFVFTANLLADNSSGSNADGLFGNGSFTITDSGSNVLLSGQVLNFQLGTLYIFLAGPGQVTLVSGSLLSDIPAGYGLGDTTSILYNLKVGPVTNFAGSFSGSTNMTIQPIPEPATMILLGLGSLTLIGRKRA